MGLGTVFHVAGSNLQASGSVGWESASAAAPAHLVSTALAVCEATVFENVGADLLFGSAHFSRVSVSFHDQPVLLSSSVSHVPASGGKVRLAGYGFVDDLQCRIGSIAPLSTRFVDSTALECVSTANAAGSSFVSVSLDSQSHGLGAVPLEFIRYPTVDEVSPSSGASSGGFALELIGSGISSMPASGTCLVGNTRGDILSLKEGKGCLAPAGSPGFTTVSVGEVASKTAVFMYREVAQVRSVSHHMAWVGDGSLFHLSGANMVKGCYVSSDSHRRLVPSYFVSSALVICDASWHESGQANMHNSEPPDAGVSVYFEQKSLVDMTSPSAIPEQGGAAFEMSGEGFTSTRSSFCSFGSISPVRGRSLEKRIECMSPAMRSREVQVGFGIDPANAVYISAVEVYGEKFVQDVNYYSASSRLIDVEIHDTLAAVPSLSGLSCQVGAEHGQVSSGAGPLHCLLTQNPHPGFASVTISRSGVPFQAEQHLFHEEPVVTSKWPTTVVLSTTHVRLQGRNLNYADGRSFSHGVFSRLSSACAVYIPTQHILPGSSSTSLETGATSGLSVTVGATVRGINHESGTDEGGTVVTMSGAFTSSVTCRFGTLGVETSRASSLNSIECVSPAHHAGPVPVGAQLVGDHVEFSDLQFNYAKAINVEPPLVKEPIFGRSALALSSTALVGIPFLCSYGALESVPASVFHDKVECPLPLLPEGFSTLKIISTEMSQASETFEFALQAPARIDRAEPASVATPGGTIVWLHGENFPNKNPECRFGNVTTAAKFVSSRMIACEASNMELAVQKSVSFMSGTLSSAAGDSITLNSEDMPLVKDLQPKVGPARGGTQLQVNGMHFSSRVPLFCHFRSVLVEALFVSETEVLCTSPSDSPGSNVDVWVSSGADSSHFDFQSLFKYVNI